MQSKGVLRAQLGPVQVFGRALLCSRIPGLSVTPKGAQYQGAFDNHWVPVVRRECRTSQKMVNCCHHFFFLHISSGQNLTLYQRYLLLSRGNPHMMTNINSVTKGSKLSVQPTKNKNNVCVNQWLSPKQAEHPGKAGGDLEAH